MVEYYSITMLTGTNPSVPLERRVLRFKEDSFGGTFYYQFTDSDGTSIDLTGGTALLRVRTPSGASSTFIGTLTTETATDGKAYYVPRSTDFATSGAYVGEFRIQYGTTRTDISPTISIMVEAAMPS